MSVVWSDDATAELIAARDAVARTNPAAAQALAGRVVAKVCRLAARPGLGAEVPEYADPALREVFEPPYRILYRTDPGGAVTVVGVYHAARRLPRTPPG